MFTRLALCLSLLLPAGTAFAQAERMPHLFHPGDPAKASEVNEDLQYLLDLFQTRRVHVHKHVTDCPNVDSYGNHYCELSSPGTAYADDAPWTTITTASVPAGVYYVVGKVNYFLAADQRNGWSQVECELRDGANVQLDFAVVTSVAHADVQAGTGWVDVVTNTHAPIVLMAAEGIPSGGGTISIRCRVQGQQTQRNLTSGASTYPVAITGVRIPGAKISAIQVGSLDLQPPTP